MAHVALQTLEANATVQGADGISVRVTAEALRDTERKQPAAELVVTGKPCPHCEKIMA